MSVPEPQIRAGFGDANQLPWLDSHEVAWAAGFFDGEGCVSLARPNRGRVVHGLVLSVRQVRREPLERFRAAIGGIGRIYLERSPGRSQPIHGFQVGQWADVQAIVAMLWKYLSLPKREQIMAKTLAHRATEKWWGKRRTPWSISQKAQRQRAYNRAYYQANKWRWRSYSGCA
jgi:hypothetical protein